MTISIFWLGKLAHLPEAMGFVNDILGVLVPKDWRASISRLRTNVYWVNLLNEVKVLRRRFARRVRVWKCFN